MIKQADYAAVGVLAELAVQLWVNHSQVELEHEFVELLTSTDAACFIKYADNCTVGFAQCQLRRDYVEGTRTSPVGYLEGIFVMKEYRHKGYAKELLSSCQQWAASQNCTEFASDCELDNENSLQFHLAMGFEVANKIICFRKSLNNN